MADEPYSKREIDLLHESIHDKLDEVLKEVKYTNGKVKKITLVLVVIIGVLLGSGLQHAPLLLGLIL